MKSLTERLGEACGRHDLEWLLLPCDLGSDVDSQIHNFRCGPFWCALMEPGPRRGGPRRHYAWNRGIKGHENDPYPDAIYFHPGPLGRKQAKRLLLAQLEEVADNGRPPAALRALARERIAAHMKNLFER